MSQRVTVAIPTYNRAEGLRRCLRAVLANQCPDLEVTVRVVDDGSSDWTPEVVAEVQREVPPGFTLHFHRQENAGPSAARNAAVALADTELIVFTDDDCVPEPDWIAALVHVPWSEKTAGIGGRIESAATDTWVSRYCRFTHYNEYPTPRDPRNFLNTASAAYRKAALEAVGGFIPVEAPGGEDIELSWRLLAAGYRLRYQPAARVHHYHREDLEALFKSFRARGYNAIRRDAMWGRGTVTWGRWRKEVYRQALWPLTIPSVIVDAVRLRRHGVRGGDLLPFAWLGWVRQGINRQAKMRMMREILDGKRSLAWPENVPPPAAAPDPRPPDPITPEETASALTRPASD